jgi:hypothetical protein
LLRLKLQIRLPFQRSKRPAKKKFLKTRKLFATIKRKPLEKLPKLRRNAVLKRRRSWKLLVSVRCKKRLQTVRPKLMLSELSVHSKKVNVKLGKKKLPNVKSSNDRPKS